MPYPEEYSFRESALEKIEFFTIFLEVYELRNIYSDIEAFIDIS